MSREGKAKELFNIIPKKAKELVACRVSVSPHFISSWKWPNARVLFLQACLLVKQFGAFKQKGLSSKNKSFKTNEMQLCLLTRMWKLPMDQRCYRVPIHTILDYFPFRGGHSKILAFANKSIFCLPWPTNLVVFLALSMIYYKLRTKNIAIGCSILPWSGLMHAIISHLRVWSACWTRNEVGSPNGRNRFQ